MILFKKIDSECWFFWHIPCNIPIEQSRFCDFLTGEFMSTFTALPSSFTSEDQSRIIDALSNDGTLQGVDLVRLQEMIANQDSSVADVADLAFVYTYLTGSWASVWDPELVSPDQVDDLQEWADLATSENLSSDIEHFIDLIGPDAELATALGGSSSMLSTHLGQSAAMTYSIDEIVTYANDWYQSSTVATQGAKRDFEGMINLAFAIGNPVLAMIYILKGFDDPATGESSEGMLSAVYEGQVNIADQMQEQVEFIQDQNDELLSLDMEDPDSTSEASVIKSNIELSQQTTSILGQSITALQGIVSDLVSMTNTLGEMIRSTQQSIWR